MQIVLPGALPDPAQARVLEPHLQRAAPTLQRWCARGRARTTTATTAQTGCTVYEQWQLTQRGFAPEAGQNLSAGLGALLAGAASAPDEPVWLAELVHIALASSGAALIPARRLALREEDSRALLASAQPLCEGSGFTLQPHSATHWRIIPISASSTQTPWIQTSATQAASSQAQENTSPFAAMLPLRCASPELVAASSIHDWWPQEPQTRAWRQLFNTVQMHWFDHPVNQTRAAQGLPPVNGLWLFGGARPAQLRAETAESMDATQVYDSLYDPWLQQDWGAWLEALADLERTVFAPLGHAPDTLVLIGGEAIVEIRPAAAWQFWRYATRRNTALSAGGDASVTR